MAKHSLRDYWSLSCRRRASPASSKPAKDGGRGREFTAVKGKTKIRAGDPAAKRWPEFFISAETPEGEWPTPGWDHAVAESERTDRAMRAAAAKREAPPIPDDEAVEVLEPFTIGFRRIEAGARFRRDDELVTKHPEFFGTVRQRLVR